MEERRHPKKHNGLEVRVTLLYWEKGIKVECREERTRRFLGSNMAPSVEEAQNWRRYIYQALDYGLITAAIERVKGKLWRPNR